MTGTPDDFAFSATWTPALFRSTSSMTEQPLVSCCCARVAYLLVSFWAFWMSVSTPLAENAFSSCGRSPFSQRFDDAASGSMTHARLAFAPDDDPESSESRLQPASEVVTRP